MISILDKNIKIGLALGAGAARGLCHIGVLEVLERENIKIDLIAGTSIGSLIGGVYATGAPLKYLKGLAKQIDFEQISDITFPRQGLIKGEKLISFLELITQRKKIEELKIPFRAIACDIETGKRIVIKEGSLAKAIRASSAIPGVYKPYYYQDKLLIDGVLVDSVPVSVVKEMGADLVIAVSLAEKKLNQQVNNIFDVLANTFDILQNEINKYRKLNADILLEPEIADCSPFDFKRASECIKLGRQVTEKSLSQIKEKIRELV